MTFSIDTHALTLASPVATPDRPGCSFGAWAVSFDADGISHGVAFGPAGDIVTRAVAAGGLD
jgi:hypothetical protein